jgi:hypothetical protein
MRISETRFGGVSANDLNFRPQRFCSSTTFPCAAFAVMHTPNWPQLMANPHTKPIGSTVRFRWDTIFALPAHFFRPLPRQAVPANWAAAARLVAWLLAKAHEIKHNLSFASYLAATAR